MTRQERAIELFDQGFNCCQAVFAPYRAPEVLDEPTALQLATAFGGGVAGGGAQLCGAITGALLAISSKYGRRQLNEAEKKDHTYALSRKILGAFEASYGGCTCEKILALDAESGGASNPDARAKLRKARCVGCVELAAELLEPVI